MENLPIALVSLAMRWLEPRHNPQLQFLREQIRMLRVWVDAERILPVPAERAELLRIGVLLDDEVTDLVHLVHPATQHRWQREQRRGHVPKKSGRSPTTREIRDLVERMSRENMRWDYSRMVT